MGLGDGLLVNGVAAGGHINIDRCASMPIDVDDLTRVNKWNFFGRPDSEATRFDFYCRIGWH